MAEARMAQSSWWSCPGEMGDPSHSIGFCLVTCAITKCALCVCSPLGPSEDRGQKSWPQLWGDGWATWATCVTELTAKANLLWHRNAFPYQRGFPGVNPLCLAAGALHLAVPLLNKLSNENYSQAYVGGKGTKTTPMMWLVQTSMGLFFKGIMKNLWWWDLLGYLNDGAINSQE